MSNTSRRDFLKSAGIFSVGFLGLNRMNASNAFVPTSNGYGPLIKDPNRIFDLPKGFSYKVVSQLGERE